MMSYEKVKSIKIKNNKVFINCASNNVRPLSYEENEYPYFTEILNKEGLDAVNVAILKNYEEGNLQNGKNKYTYALKVLYYVFEEEYKPFKWGWNVDNRVLRESEDFKKLLLKCLNYKKDNRAFIISKQYGNEVIYGKKCPSCMKWTRDINEATKYDFYKEAEENIFNAYKGVWNVEELNENQKGGKTWKKN